MLQLLWLIPFLPLASSVLLGTAGRRMGKRAVNALGIGSAGLAFVTALAVASAFLQLPPEQIPVRTTYFTWLAADSFHVQAGFYLDQLSLVMVLVVSGVGFLIHVYSIGYMAHEGGYYRFFCYMNLFMFFMLLLVMAGDYALMFVGWEGVGLCSYLLIGFFFLRKSAGDAGKKAFILNRVGDFGFLLGLFLLFKEFRTLDFDMVFANAGMRPVESFAPTAAGPITVIALLLLVGALGKSAQIPLYVWLPDAMEGPTPVSALIHAATMVAAGVYMVARSHILYTHAPLALTAVATIGCLTALYAATIGLVQTDIKRVLAYSTISQLGYMFLALGVGAFSAGIFHLMTHAFFKALLFLGAGSVIHAMGGQQDIYKMGALRKRIPITYWTFLFATLAIVGAPGFSGFFSKDEILWQTFSTGNQPLWWLGLGAAVLTSFYMFRLLFLVFHGEARYTPETARQIHESPRVMIIPLIVLGILSLAGGWVGVPAALGGANQFKRFLGPVFAESRAILDVQAAVHTHEEELALMGLTVLLAAAGFAVAYAFYIRRPELASLLSETFHRPYRILLNKYYVDELYSTVLVRPLHWLSERVLWQVIDVELVDGTVNGAAGRTRGLSAWARRLQSGNVRSYAAWVVLGVVLVLVLLFSGAVAS